MLGIAYYNVSVVKVNAVVTIAANVLFMIIAPKGYLQMHSLIVWIFIMIVFILCVLATVSLIVESMENVKGGVENLANVLNGN